MPHATVPSSGLQALILCGPGASLSIFASNPADFSKALIPIANRPMVWYPLDWCYHMGIHDITLVTPPESKSALEAALATNPSLTSLPNPKPEILAPRDLTQTSGTGDLLRSPEVQKAITSDFVILPCDLISELPGTSILQQWMSLNPLSVSSKRTKRKGGLAVYYPTQGLEGISQKKEETDFIATTPFNSSSIPPPNGSLLPQIETLVMSMPTDTVNDKLEEDKGVLKVRTRLTQKYGRVKLKTRHRDAHVYVLPEWVKDYAARNEKFDSISEDVIGWWAKAQWQDGLGEKLGMDLALDKPSHTEEENLADSSHFDESDILDASQLSSTKASQAIQAPLSTTLASRVGNAALQSGKEPLHIPPLLAYVQPSPTATAPSPEQPLIRRVDTTASLLAISLYFAKQQPGASTLAHEHKLHPTAKVGLQSRVSQEDSLVAENVTLGSRSIVKESVIGANCEIGNNVRLTRCLLMDGVVVGDGVQLTGCTVGRRARIEGLKAAPETAPNPENADASKKKAKKGNDDDEDRTKLTDCEVAPHFVVEAGTEAKGEQLMAFGGDLDDDMDDDMVDDMGNDVDDDDDDGDDNEDGEED